MNKLSVKLIEFIITPLGWALRKKRAGEQKSYQFYPQLLSTKQFQLSSPSFQNGEEIPEIYTKLGSGKNISPELRWGTTPTETKQFFLFMEDIDIPSDKPGIHLAAFFSPGLHFLPEGTLVPGNKEITYIPDKKGRLGYQGPRPLPGHGQHRYRFHLLALDKIILTSNNFDDIISIADGHVVAAAHLEGLQKG